MKIHIYKVALINKKCGDSNALFEVYEHLIGGISV